MSLSTRAQSDAAPESHWRLAEGEVIGPGRTALKRLGGGRRYDAYLAWDDHLHSVVVCKLVRPHLVGDEHTLAGLAGEWRDARASQPPGHRPWIRPRPRWTAAAPGSRAPRGAEAVDADPPLRAVAVGAARAARAPAVRRGSLPERGGRRAPRHQAFEHDHGCAGAIDRPQRGAGWRRSCEARARRRHRCVYGTGAV